MITPLKDKVFVKAKRKEKTESGIYLPEKKHGKDFGGIVAVVHPGDTTFKEGDEVFFDKYTEKRIRIDDEEYCVARKEKVLAIIRDNEIIATGDKVIVKVKYDEKIGNIVIPEYQGSKEYQSGFHGEVVSVGPEYPNELNKGDRVYFRRHEGKPFRYNEEDYMSLKEKWVVGRVE